MKDSVFREYDIRGIVGTELFVNQVYGVTQAILSFFKSKNPHVTTVVVGMDGRTHSPAIKDEVCRSLQDSGINVIFIGVIPSPVLYFALHTKPVDAGLMITASHNPKEYNGIKICLGTQSLWGQDIQAIKTLFHQNARVQAAHRGTLETVAIIPEYIKDLKERFPHLVGSPIPFIVDCGNGATGTVVPDLVTAMEWNAVQQLCCTVDGTYPNHPADPTVAKNMEEVKELLQKTDAQFGIGFDGDGDRLGVMTKEGALVSGDKLLALFAQWLRKEKNEPVAVAFDIKSSSGLIELLEAWGITPIMSPSGHSIVKNEMIKHGAQLGGELSCHLFFKDRHYGYDDAIYAALRLLEGIMASGKNLEALLAAFPSKCSSIEYRLAYPEDQREVIMQTVKEYLRQKPTMQLIEIDGVRASAPYGWGLLRPSNTQAVLSLRFESDTPEGLNKIKQEFAAQLKPFVPEKELIKIFNE